MDDYELQQSKQFVTHVVRIDRNLSDLRRSFHKTTIQQRIRQAERIDLSLEVTQETQKIDHAEYVDPASK